VSYNDMLKRKLESLKEWFHNNCRGRAIVAVSGGVDSSLVLYAAASSIGPERVLAVTTKSPINLEEDTAWAEKISSLLGVRHLELETDELKDPNFVKNPPNRCYFCKMNLYELMERIRGENDLMVDGLNASDLKSHRPGFYAKKKYNVRSPLAELGLTKEEIRQIAKIVGLPNWDKPSESCLASRIPYGEEVTYSKLRVVREAERVVKELAGVTQVRVRHHGVLARIEVPKTEMRKLFNEFIIDRIAQELSKLGFIYVTLDLQGYRSGSMDLVLSRKVIPIGELSKVGE
jgi:uncharacterized protein